MTKVGGFIISINSIIKLAVLFTLGTQVLCI